MKSNFRILGSFFVIWLLLCFNQTSGKVIFCPESSEASDKVVDFKSQTFFGLVNQEEDSLTCEVVINLPRDFYAVRIDFVDVAMDGPSIFADESNPGLCDSDMFFFKGFDDWTPPPRCGSLEGYSFLIDETANLRHNSFKIVAVMSTSSYKWHIRITQVDRPTKSAYNLALTKANRENNDEDGLKTEANEKFQKRRASNETFFVTKPVMHGVSANPLWVPYLVSVRKHDEIKFSKARNCSDVFYERETICGGSIIGERFVLTAASCFYQIKKFLPRNAIHLLEVVAGDVNLCSEEKASDEFKPSYHKVAAVVYHYGYDPFVHLHDIAVIVLAEPIKFAPHIQPIKLIKEDDTTKSLKGLISGFGAWDLQSEGYYVNKSNFLDHPNPKDFFPFGPQVSELTLSPSDSCSFSKVNRIYQSAYGEKPFEDITKYSHVPKSMRCAIVDKKSHEVNPNGTAGWPGYRDNGGPFVTVQQDDGYARLAAVILKIVKNPWGRVKNEHLFASVAYYRNWIQSVVMSYNSPNA